MTLFQITKWKVQACSNNIVNTEVDSQDKVVDDNDNWCEVEEGPSGSTDTL